MRLHILIVLMFALFSQMVLSQPINMVPNEQYSLNGNAVMHIEALQPIVVQNTGIQANFDYVFERLDNTLWRATACPLPSYNALTPQEKASLLSVPVVTLQGSPTIPTFISMNNGCINFTISGKAGDTFKIGTQSTIIEIQNSTAQLTVTPDNQSCSTTFCTSTITIKNTGIIPLTFSTDDVTVTAEGNPTIDLVDQTATSTVIPKNITLLPTMEYTLKVMAQFRQSREKFKYNVTYNYLGTDYTVDPYFSTGDAPQDISLLPINNNTIIIAYINRTNYDLYFTIQDTNGTTKINPILVDTTLDSHSRVSTTKLNDSEWILTWVNGTNGGLTTNFVVAATYDFQGNNVFPQTAIHGYVESNVDVSVFELGDRFGFCFINQADDDADIKMYYNNHTQFVSEVGTEFDGGVGASLTLQNLAECSAINNTYFAYAWFDDSGGTNDATWSRANQTAQDRNVIDLDLNIGETGQIATTGIGNNTAAFVWYDSSTDEIYIDLAPLSGTDNFAPFVVDTTIGGDSRVAIGTIKTNDSDEFAIAYFNSTALLSATFYHNGTIKTAPFIVNESINISLVDVVGKQPVLGNSICTDNYVIGYVSDTGNGITQSYYSNGSSWNGICASNICTENWVQLPTPCTGVQQLIIYNDTNSCGTNLTLPVDNGTFGSCSQFSCESNKNIVFDNKMEWICEFPEDAGYNKYNCISTITQGDEFIQANPEPFYVPNFGEISSFEEQRSLVNVYFTTKDLRRGQTYNFSVSCYSKIDSTDAGIFTVETTPKDILFADWGMDRMIWAKDNAAYLFGAIFVFGFLLFLVRVGWKAIKD